MKLTNARVKKYQNIVDSEDVSIEDDITCLVGKNESGKTAFLQAIHKLNPHHSNTFKALDQYPRWRYKLDERKGEINSEPVVLLTFKLSNGQIKKFEERYGKDVLKSEILKVSKNYDNELFLEADIDELKLFKNLALKLDDSSELRKAVSQKKTIESFIEDWDRVYEEEESPSDNESQLNDLISGGMSVLLEELFIDDIPTIFYFSQYSTLPGRIKLEDFLGKSLDGLSGKERTASVLLELAGTDKESIKTDEFEDRIAELEASASLITQQVLEYWSQNDHISVDFKVDKDIERQPNGNHQVRAHFLDIRMRDSIHGITINFDRRSSGFKWFFSFLVAFSEFDNQEKPLIILLDEPGLNLHAKAQNDLLRYIKEKLSVEHQIIYTTHSPFMVEPSNLHKVRLVEDLTTIKNKVGTKITDDVFSTNQDTIFPLQSALGYDIAQNLFVGKNNVIIEGTSDFVYLNLISRFLEEKGRSHLDFSKVTLTPVGGASKIATFVALLGQHLSATVFMDADHRENQRVIDLIGRGLLSNDKYITVADILDDMDQADIEDLFMVEDYLELYNDTFSDDLKESELNGSDQIVRRISRARANFDHGKPADIFLRNPDKYLKKLSDDTLDNFEKAIEAINSTLEG